MDHAIPISVAPRVAPKSHSPTPQFTEDGLILPRKLINPFTETKEKKDLQRELLFNQKIGKNVLDQKSELEKVMAKRAKDARAKEKEAEEKAKSNNLERKSSFEKKLAEQAAKLAKSSLSDAGGSSSDNGSDTEIVNYDNLPQGQAEFLKIHAKIKSHCSAVSPSNPEKDAGGLAPKVTASTGGQENISSNKPTPSEIRNLFNSNPKGL